MVSSPLTRLPHATGAAVKKTAFEILFILDGGIRNR